MRSQHQKPARHRGGRWAAVFIGSGLFLASCGGSPASPAPAGTQPAGTSTPDATTGTEAPTATAIGERTFDAGFDEVTIEGIPERPYAWGFQEVDSLAVLGVEPVGLTTRGDAIPEYLEVDWPDAQILGEPPSLEQVVALRPDVVIADESNEVDPLRDIAPVLRMRANSYQEAMDQLLILGEMFAKEDEAQDFVDEFESTLEETQEAAANEEAVSAMVIYPGAEPGVLGMWLDTSFTGSLVEALGVDYALKASDLSGSDTEGDNAEFAERFGLVQLGLEKVIQLDPELLFVLGTDDFVAELEQNPAWASLSAVQADNVHVFDRDIWSRARGPKAALVMVQQGRNALFPELFPEAPDF